MHSLNVRKFPLDPQILKSNANEQPLPTAEIFILANYEYLRRCVKRELLNLEINYLRNFRKRTDFNFKTPRSI